MSMPVGGALLLLTTWLKARDQWRAAHRRTRPNGQRINPAGP
jgi:hypothetical protein